MKLKESRLKKPIISFLRGLGCNDSKTELSFMDRGIDVFGLQDIRPYQTYAVELKITNWQKALRQAAIYQLCADYCYVAMPMERAQTLQLRHFRAAGVGVLGVDLESQEVEIFSAAKKSSVKRPSYSSYMQKAARR